MQLLSAKRQGNCIVRYSKRLRNQKREYLVNLKQTTLKHYFLIVFLFPLSVYGGHKFLTNLDSFRRLGSIGIGLGISYCHNTLASFKD